MDMQLVCQSVSVIFTFCRDPSHQLAAQMVTSHHPSDDEVEHPQTDGSEEGCPLPLSLLDIDSVRECLSAWVVTEPAAIVGSGLSPAIFYMTMSCTGWFVNYTVVIYVNTRGYSRLDANEMRSTWWSIINQHCITYVAWSNIDSWAVFSVYNASDKLLVTIWRA